MSESIIEAIIGGLLIGSSATVLLLFKGRIAGICGILFSLFTPSEGDRHWRASFLVSMIIGAGLAHFALNKTIPEAPTDGLGLIIIAGLLTGIGTYLGNGCTSGHGVCGIARKSTRSIVATITFMATGIITVTLMRNIL
mgnify:CR=1 FL=1